MTVDNTMPGAAVRGRVVDRHGLPLGLIDVSARLGDTIVTAQTGDDGTFLLSLPTSGTYSITLGEGSSNPIAVTLAQHDVAIIEWQEFAVQPQSLLPLAEIRTVNIMVRDNLVFRAASPWPDAAYRWSVSGGALELDGDKVIWKPPLRAGRYLLQLIADWGRAGLAVDSMVLQLEGDGSLSIS